MVSAALASREDAADQAEVARLEPLYHAVEQVVYLILLQPKLDAAIGQRYLDPALGRRAPNERRHTIKPRERARPAGA